MENEFKIIEDDKECVQKEGEGKKTNIKYLFCGFLAAFAVIVFSIIGFVSYRAEKNIATDGFTLFVANIIHLPAGFVNSNYIGYVEFLGDMKAVRKFYASQAGASGAAPTEKQMFTSVWERLAKNKILEKLAKEKNIILDAKEVDAEVENFIKDFPSKEKAEEMVKTNYDWDLENFKKRIITPFLLQSKVGAAIDEELNVEAKKKAEEILAKIKDGSKFEDMAKEFGEDGTRDKGGDLGWFSKGAMVPEFEDAVSKMEKGQVSGLVKTSFGYHLIKLEDKRLDKNKEQEWNARHILIKGKSVEDYLNELLKKAKIWKWIKI